jgi:AbiV family abortive infection protein
MTASIADVVLLQGAWYAFAQAGQLMRDAVILYEAKAYSSATALALLGREELGRYRILCDLWQRANAGEVLSRDDVRRACEDHVEKQRRGALSLMYRASAQSTFGKLLRSLVGLLPSSGVARKIRKAIADIDAQKLKRLPDDRHAARMRSLYVDLKEGGLVWSRPSSIEQTEASTTVVDAMNDYSTERDRLTTPGILAVTKPDLARAFEAWVDRPSLPEVLRPSRP